MILTWIKKVALTALASWAKSWLKSTSNDLWDDLWRKVFYYVDLAEKQYFAPGIGQYREEYVIKWVTYFLDDNTKLSGWQKAIVLYLVKKAIKRAISELNKALGHNWRETAEALQKYIEGFFHLDDWWKEVEA